MGSFAVYLLSLQDIIKYGNTTCSVAEYGFAVNELLMGLSSPSNDYSHLSKMSSNARSLSVYNNNKNKRLPRYV